jgi:ABC transport system ATP-binding/permease protein
MNIAPVHATIGAQNGRRAIHDAGSPIGTSVNGQRVSSQMLRDGDLIQIGSMKLEFHEKATASRIAPPVDTAKPSVKIPEMAGICPFCGSKKDASGKCACSVGGQATQQQGWQQPVPQMPTMQQPIPAQTTVGMPQAPQQTGSGPRLVALSGPYAGQTFAVSPDGPTTVGRDPSRTVQLPMDSTVSRMHARIENEGGAFIVYDEGSSNGTSVNGARVTRQQISPGDTVEFGSSGFRFEI